MTHTEALETWQHAEQLAARMYELGIDQQKIDAMLVPVAKLCERLLDEIERAS